MPMTESETKGTKMHRLTLDIHQDWYKKLRTQVLQAQLDGESVSIASLIRDAIEQVYFPAEQKKAQK